MLLRRHLDRRVAFDVGEALFGPLDRPDDGAERGRVVGRSVFAKSCRHGFDGPPQHRNLGAQILERRRRGSASSSI